MASVAAKRPPASPVPVIKVQVTSTPAGFLRVRKEPSLTSAEIGRVKTGDQLEVVTVDAPVLDVHSVEKELIAMR